MAKTQGPTYNPSKIKRIRKFGFLSRMGTVGGKNVVRRRRAKKRTKLSASSEFGSNMEKNKKFGRRR